MAATARIKVYTGTNAATENPDAAPGTNAANINVMNTDTYDSTGILYQGAPMVIPSSGTNYSFERWLRIHFSGSFTTVSNILLYRNSGSLSDAALIIKAGATVTAATPTQSASSIATSSLPTTSGTALDITPVGGLSAAGYSKYAVLQLVIPSTVVTSNAIGAQSITYSYDET